MRNNGFNMDDYKKIEIKHDGEVQFEFNVRRISSDEIFKCWERAEIFSPRRNSKKKNAKHDKLIRFRFRLMVIYAATIDEDKAKIWDNREIQQKYGAKNRTELIDVTLKGDKYKDAIIGVICEFSGVDIDILFDEIVLNKAFARLGGMK